MKIPTDQNTIVQNLLRALVLLFLLRTIFVFISSTEFWGLNISYYLPKESSIIFLALAAISLLIGFNLHERKLKKNKSLEIDSKKSSFDNYVLLILLVTCSVLFLTIKIAWPFLGDGSIFAGYLFKFHETGKMTIWWTEAPSMYLQYGIYYVKLLLTSKGDSFFPFTVISVISGIFFVGISYKFSKTLSSISFMQGIILSLLLGAGGTLFFFSYMETYPLQYSFVLLYTYFAYKYFMHKSDLLRCWLVLIFCIILHLQNILLVPSFLLILYWKKTEGERRYPSVYKVLLLTSPVLLAIYGASQFFLQEKSFTGRDNPFIPFFSTPNFHYTLFSFQHLIDILNEHILLASVSVTVILSIFISQSKKSWQNKFIQFLVVNIFFFEAYLIGGCFVFGLARDWDVTASLGIFLPLLSSVLLIDQIKDSLHTKKVAIPIITLSLISILFWISVNVNQTAATRRYEDILEIYTPLIEKTSAQYGYENLRKFYQGGSPEDEFWSLEKKIDINPVPADLQNVFVLARNNPTSIQMHEGLSKILNSIFSITEDTILAKEVFNSIRLGVHSTGENITLGDFYESGIDLLVMQKFLTVSEGIQKAEQFILAHPTLPYGYQLQGRLFFNSLHDPKKALPFLEKAVSLDSLRARPYGYLGVDYALAGDFQKSLGYFRIMVQFDPQWITGLEWYVVILTTDSMGTSVASDLNEVKKILVQIIDNSSKFHTDAMKEYQSIAVRQAQILLKKIDVAISRQK